MRYLIVGSIALGWLAFASLAEAAAFQAYDNTGSTAGGAGGNLNIGHEFSVTGSGITVQELGVYDVGAHVLLDNHAVTLFSISNFGVPTSVTPLASVGIAAGLSSASEFVYAPLSSPLFLPAGRYGIIAYDLNSTGRDPYGDGGGLPDGVATLSPNVEDDLYAGTRFDPYQFSGGPSPNFPTAGDANDHSSASFHYDIGNTTPEPASLTLIGLSSLGLLARRRA